MRAVCAIAQFMVFYQSLLLSWAWRCCTRTTELEEVMIGAVSSNAFAPSFRESYKLLQCIKYNTYPDLYYLWFAAIISQYIIQVLWKVITRYGCANIYVVCEKTDYSWQLAAVRREYKSSLVHMRSIIIIVCKKIRSTPWHISSVNNVLASSIQQKSFFLIS